MDSVDIDDPTFLAIGLMSGTSMDGIDAAILHTNGTSFAESIGDPLTMPYSNELKDKIRQNLKKQVPDDDTVLLENQLTVAHANCIQAILELNHKKPSDISYIGFHGQTIYHNPDKKFTWQIGDGTLLAKLTNIPVVNQFRMQDVINGGQGAPLVPVYHTALARSILQQVSKHETHSNASNEESKMHVTSDCQHEIVSDVYSVPSKSPTETMESNHTNDNESNHTNDNESNHTNDNESNPLIPMTSSQPNMLHLAKFHISCRKPICFINIGGVSNITYISDCSVKEEDISTKCLAFDTGPGNGLLDDLIHQSTLSLSYDEDGSVSKCGTIQEELLNQWFETFDSFFQKSPPKSLDRSMFGQILQDLQDHKLQKNLSLEDSAATLAAFTAKTLVSAIDHLPSMPHVYIVCGGGRHNPTILRFLSMYLNERSQIKSLSFQPIVLSIGAFGYDGDFIEAQAFAYLAVRHIRQLPLSFPSTTGVKQPTIGGELHTL